MDNEKLEIVGNEDLMVDTEVSTGLNLSTPVSIGIGVAAGAIGGYLLYRFVAKPIIAKIKAKKTEQATPAEEPAKAEPEA